MDIHNYKRQYERQIELLKEDENILQVNKDSAIKFKDYLISDGIGVAKIGRYLLDVRKFSKMLNKPFKEANKDDLKKYCALDTEAMIVVLEKLRGKVKDE